jgi:hypothetical protein
VHIDGKEKSMKRSGEGPIGTSMQLANDHGFRRDGWSWNPPPTPKQVAANAAALAARQERSERRHERRLLAYLTRVCKEFFHVNRTTAESIAWAEIEQLRAKDPQMPLYDLVRQEDLWWK